MENYCIDETISEFCGAIMGDGNIWSNGRKYEITVTGNIITDREYFDYIYFFVHSRIKKPYYRIRGRGLRLTIYSKKFYQFITKKMGIPPRVLKCKFGIPPKICATKKLLRAFIRGLFDTDGSVFTSNKKGSYNYPTLEITNSNQILLMQVYKTLMNMKFRINYRHAGNGSYKVSIYGMKMLAKWKDEIGSSNPHKMRRINTILESFR